MEDTGVAHNSELECYCAETVWAPAGASLRTLAVAVGAITHTVNCSGDIHWTTLDSEALMKGLGTPDGLHSIVGDVF